MKIEFSDVEYSYPGERKVLSGLSFSVGSGETVALLGRNGAGKTTLFRLLLGMLRPVRGRITLDGTDSAGIPDRKRAGMISYIPQSAGAAFPYTVLQTVLMGTAAGLSVFARPGRKEREKAMEALSFFGLEDRAGRLMPHLSGGERQMVMIARALAQDAGFIILDEPTSSLDYGNQISVLEMLGDLGRKGLGILCSMHDPELAMRYSSRIMMLTEGRIGYDGPPAGLVGNDTLGRLYGRRMEVTSMETEAGTGYVCMPL